MHDRVAGVLLHPTSLPGPWGMGDFGPQAELFLDWAAAVGFGLWQVLPLGPSAAAHSPYTALSAFALDPFLISLERLVESGLLHESDLPEHLEAQPSCDFAAAERIKGPRLRQAWETFKNGDFADLRLDFENFEQDPLQKSWLDDWCLFAALRRHHEDAAWWTWDVDLRSRQTVALDKIREQLADEIGFERFLQSLAFHQWHQLRRVAKDRGITILGDLPIYVAHDSAEVWAKPHLFELDAEGQPLGVAGVPPDYYAEDGQLWGNPLYRWQVMAEDGFRWWVDRLRANLALADLVRLDHFRGFADYWCVPGDAATARDGAWQDGPGQALFDAFTAQIGTPLPVLAEDLGDLSDKVHELRRAVDLPGMKVLHFGFDSADSDHAPFRLTPETLFYTGTHDNDTSLGWFAGLSEDVKAKVLTYAGGGEQLLNRHLIRVALTSVARWVVVPMQDVLGLGSEARMNIPGVAEGNWTWRLQDLPDSEQVAWLRPLIEVSGRHAAV